MSMRRGRVLPDHQPVHLHPTHGPGIARRFGLNHDPLDHRPARRHLSARNERPRASASEIFPGEDFEGASRQLDRQNNIVIGGKQKRSPTLSRDRRPAPRYRLQPSGWPRCRSLAIHARCNPKPFLPFAWTIARIRALPSAGLYSLRKAVAHLRVIPAGDFDRPALGGGTRAEKWPERLSALRPPLAKFS